MCELIKVGLILCLNFIPGEVTEMECTKKSETTICVEPNFIGDCHIDSADDFIDGYHKFDEVVLVRWMNDSCMGFVDE